MTKDLISVIVPVYNGEKYIRPCVASIRGQSYEKLEIILVDDGSADNSLRICKDLAAEDPRILVVHQENRGLGPARNFGMEHASGEFIGFCDVDDTMDPRMYAALYDMIVSTGADFADCGHASIHNGVNNFRSSDGGKIHVLDRVGALRAFAAGQGITWGVWDKLFRASSCEGIWASNEKIRAQDIIFLLDFIKANDCFCWADLGYYWYNRTNDDSLTKRKWSLNNLGLTRFYRELAETVAAYGLEDLRDTVNVRHYENLLSTFIRCVKGGFSAAAKEILGEMREKTGPMLRSGLSGKYKADWLLCLAMPHLTSRLHFWYK